LNKILGVSLSLSLLSAPALAASESYSLRGSLRAMQEQNQVAKEHGLSFLLSPDQVGRAVARGDLVELTGGEDYEVAEFVTHPFAVPAVRNFVERLGSGYRAACGQRLVVTSAVRPLAQQPKNAHALSVHPAGMAVDLRVSDRATCREWLEKEVVRLRDLGVINGIREYSPPHYHIAIYPGPYQAMVDVELAEARAQAEREAERVRSEAAAARLEPAPVPVPPQAADGGNGAVPLSLAVVVAAVGGGLLFGVRLPSRRSGAGWAALRSVTWWSGSAPRNGWLERLRRVLQRVR
jgi:hypothetical protein